jgi:gliding motility-associated-like protein
MFCDQWTKDVTNWMWNFGDGSPQDSTNTDPAHSYSASVTNNDFYNFTISLAVQNQYGCWDTISKTIEILPEYTFYIPNTFTPNGDGDNETFFGKCRGVKEYTIWLFDRWGNQVWTCHYSGKNTDWDKPGQDGLSSFCKWDGVVVSGGLDMGGNSRQLAQEDVYVWKVNLTDIFDKRHTYIGHVNIVR